MSVTLTLVTGEAQDDQARILVLVVQRLEAFVLHGEGGAGGGVSQFMVRVEGGRAGGGGQGGAGGGVSQGPRVRQSGDLQSETCGGNCTGKVSLGGPT